jgi:acyl carrier protein
MKNEITEWIINILIDKYLVQAGEVSPSSIYDDLALDSLALLEIIATLEKEFGVEIPIGVITSEMSIEQSAASVLKGAA